jgi:nitrous oxidase accessory protein NosD
MGQVMETRLLCIRELYYEAIVVNKTLTLRGMGATIDPTGTPWFFAINVTAARVTIRGFIIKAMIDIYNGNSKCSNNE